MRLVVFSRQTSVNIMSKKEKPNYLAGTIIFVVLILCTGINFSQEVHSEPIIIQEIKTNNRSFYNVPPSLVNSLRGVKYAFLPIGNKDLVDLIVRNPNSFEAQVISGIVDYLKRDLFLKGVAWTPAQKEELSAIINNPCEAVSVYINEGDFIQDLGAIGRRQGVELGFTFCDGQTYIIKTNFGVSGLTNYSTKYRKHFSKIINLKGLGYNKDFERVPREVSLFIEPEELDKRIHDAIDESISKTKDKMISTYEKQFKKEALKAMKKV